MAVIARFSQSASSGIVAIPLMSPWQGEKSDVRQAGTYLPGEPILYMSGGVTTVSTAANLTKLDHHSDLSAANVLGLSLVVY
jgi:hypothetical protein